MILRTLAHPRLVGPIYTAILAGAVVAVARSGHALDRWRHGEDPTPPSINSASTGAKKIDLGSMARASTASSTSTST